MKKIIAVFLALMLLAAGALGEGGKQPRPSPPKKSGANPRSERAWALNCSRRCTSPAKTA